NKSCPSRWSASTGSTPIPVVLLLGPASETSRTPASEATPLARSRTRFAWRRPPIDTRFEPPRATIAIAVLTSSSSRPTERDERAENARRVCGSELSAQLADVDVHVLVLALVGLAPDRTKKPALRDKATLIGQQDPQDLEFSWCEFDMRSIDADGVAGQVELE